MHPTTSVRREVRRILSVGIEALSAEEAVSRLDAAIDARAGLKVAFANANLLNLAATMPALSNALTDFLILNDGIGVELASRLLYGRGFPANLNGTDFVPFWLEQTAAPRRVMLIGARPGVAEAARAALAHSYPVHTFAGAIDGYGGLADWAAVERAVRTAAPDVILVALGNPRQELWIDREAATLAPSVAIGVGALFDFLAGEVIRAPAFVRAARMEWIWRLLQEPRRLARRYVVGNAAFLTRVAAQRLNARHRNSV